ncbi:LacI family DNA-binding transcriptional regulator, partial [Salmonella enterica subsp. enterica serovar Mbandaka]
MATIKDVAKRANVSTT